MAEAASRGAAAVVDEDDDDDEVDGLMVTNSVSISSVNMMYSVNTAEDVLWNIIVPNVR